MTTALFAIVSVCLLLSACETAAAEHNFIIKGEQMVEELYVQDCKQDKSPHGYYGAYLQPCEFAFFKPKAEEDSLTSETENPCSEDSSTLISKPVPFHWFFNLTDHLKKNDWDKMSSDDLDKVAENLMLWPDQCVGVEPRCYSLHDGAIRDTLHQIFANGDTPIPIDATHVRVDCRGDAVALSKVIYTFADISEPFVVAYIVTVVVVGFLVAFSLCFCCSWLFCHHFGPRPHVVTATATPVARKEAPGVVRYVAVQPHQFDGYTSVHGSTTDDNDEQEEKLRLM